MKRRKRSREPQMEPQDDPSEIEVEDILFEPPKPVVVQHLLAEQINNRIDFLWGQSVHHQSD